MYSWRITKYDPLKRDADGSYLDLEEWTCFSEVGTKVSMEEYQKQEEKYVHAITTFMAEMGLNRVYVIALEHGLTRLEIKVLMNFYQRFG